MNKKIVIIGAGPAGLGAAWRLQESGYDNWHICERNNYVGGLSASFTDDKGFIWDIGGHVLFSHFDYFDRLLEKILGQDYIEHERLAFIRMMDRWVPYPFQNNIHYLPLGPAFECLKGMYASSRKRADSPADFKQWIVANFGEGVGKYFMFPHNQKVWSYPLEDMSYSWIGERVSVVAFRRILKNFILRINDASWGPNSTFKFPLYGGTGEIFRRFAPFIKNNLSLNTEIIGIDTKNKEIALKDGSKSNYDIIINTMPLNRLTAMLGEQKLIDASGDLKHNSVFVVGLGLKKDLHSSRCWVYFPEDKAPFYRLTYFSRYSPNNVPGKGYSSLMCEIAHSHHRPYNKDAIIEDVIKGLINTGILEPQDKKFIVSTYIIGAEYAYPIPTLARDKALNFIQQALKEKDIYSRGRFGAWKYETGNMDYSVMQGVEIADAICQKS